MTASRTGTCLAMAFALSLAAQFAWAAPLPKPYACQKAKLRATSRAFSCLAVQEYRAIRGATADFTRCTSELASAFASAESQAEGQCISTGDAAVAQAQIEEAIVGQLVTLNASLATNSDFQRCLGKQLKLTRRFATCQADALSRRIGGAFNGHGGAYFAGCKEQFDDGLAAAHANYTCVATPETRDAMLWAGGGFAYVPSFEALGDTGADYFHAVLTHGNLSNANLSGVRMLYVDTRAADFSGADLSGSGWLDAATDGANFAGADLSGAQLRYTTVTDALLGDANLDESCWIDVDGRSGTGGCPATLPADWTCQGGWLLGPNLGCGYDVWHLLLPHEDVDFSAANLTSADFTNRRFDSGTFAGANLTSAVFRGVDFKGTDLSNCDFTGADLRRAVVDGGNLAGANMATANFDTYLYAFRGISLTGCPASLPTGWDCRAGTLVGPSANLDDVDLIGADLSGVNLTGARLIRADLSGATFTGATLTGATLHSTTVTGANFATANLTSLYSGMLTGCPASLPPNWICIAKTLLGPTAHPYAADLSGADLSGLVLSGAKFIDLDLTGANLTGTNLSGVLWSNATCPDGTSSSDNGATCCGHHVGSPPLVCD